MSHYAELHAISNFTFLRGASHPEELVSRAGELAYQALALTDECSLAGAVRAHLAAREQGFHLILGSELQLQDGLRLVLLATNRRGYGQLSRLITCARRAAGKGQYRLARNAFAEGLPDCLALWLPPRWRPGNGAIDQLGWISETFPERTWIAVELLRQTYDRCQLDWLQLLAKQSKLPLVAAGDVHMHRRQRQALQDVLTAIRLGTSTQQAGTRFFPNSERHLRHPRDLTRIYPDALLEESLQIAQRCHFSLDELRYEYPEELVPQGYSPASYLRELTELGVRWRWPSGPPQKVLTLIEHELHLISELQYEPYFLTVHDIVHFARTRNILCQGRGSAANSAVCYCLGITEVDPARMDLLFERFISKERNEPPDIDVDFEHERREEIIQYIYRKYGRDRAALTATVVRYRPRSALRDGGKALGLNLNQLDRLTKSLAWWDGQQVHPQRLQESGFDPANPILRRLLKLVQSLIGFPRHLSQHTGGFVISRGPISELVPIENAAMPKRTVIQWDKDDLDALGLLKIDCLALGMLTAIHKAFDLIKLYRGRDLCMASIPTEDPDVYTMIQKADTIGVFQIESRAQMAMLPRLRPAGFYDLVIEVAIVRPGPIQGDMVHPYLRRRQGLESVTYPNQAVENILGRTLGIPIFQEQVIQLAMVAAGFSPGEADQLRRSMAAWRRRGNLSHLRQRLINGMCSRGYELEFAQRIYQQIQGFGEYGFPESHSASFALLVYASAWLKYHEPAIFTCALLNSQPMGFYAPAQLVQDARRHDVEVRPVDIRYSHWDCSIEPGKQSQPALRLGLRYVKGLTQAGGRRLVQERQKSRFVSIPDMAHRAGLRSKDLEALANADALSGLSGHRHCARWVVGSIEPERPLFAGDSVPETTPVLRQPGEGEDIIDDYTYLGLSLRRHPMALLRERLDRLNILTTQQVREKLPHGETAHTAGLVISRQRPSSTDSVTFITLEDETGYINLIVWKRFGDAQRRTMLSARLMGVVGEVQREGDVIHVIARKLEDHSPLLGGLATHSRDFC